MHQILWLLFIAMVYFDSENFTIIGLTKTVLKDFSVEQLNLPIQLESFAQKFFLMQLLTTKELFCCGVTRKIGLKRMKFPHRHGQEISAIEILTLVKMITTLKMTSVAVLLAVMHTTIINANIN